MKVVVDKPIVEKDKSKAVPPEKLTDVFASERSNLPALLVGPVVPSVKANDVAYAEIIALCIEDLEHEGFKRGAVVVSGGLFQDHRIDPIHWGFIVGFNREHRPGGVMRLLKVKWANGSYEDVSEKHLRIVYRPYWQSEEQLKEKLMSTSYP